MCCFIIPLLFFCDDGRRSYYLILIPSPCICRGVVDSGSQQPASLLPQKSNRCTRPLPSIMTYMEFVPHAKSIVASAAAPFVANSSNTPGMSAKPTVSPSFTFSHINDDSWQTFVGVTLSLLGSFCFIIGWKYMHDANIERLEAGKDAVAVQQADKKWYAAVALNVLAGLLDAGAFAFAAQSIINSLGGVSVILYALIIPCWNRRELEHLKATKFAAFYGCFVIVRILCSRLLLLVTPTTSNPNLFSTRRCFALIMY